MSETFIPSVVVLRWNEAQTIQQWRSLAYMAGFMADSVEPHEPDSILVAALRGIADAAHTRMMYMQPREVSNVR